MRLHLLPIRPRYASPFVPNVFEPASRRGFWRLLQPVNDSALKEGFQIPCAMYYRNNLHGTRVPTVRNDVGIDIPESVPRVSQILPMMADAGFCARREKESYNRARTRSALSMLSSAM